MYYDFFQLSANPFAITADPAFYFASDSHAEAFSNLVYGIQERKGIIAITGEIGTGKTTLCRKLLKHSFKKVKFALVLNPSFSELELLQMILHDFKIKTRETSKLGMVQALNHYLLKQTKKGFNVVLVIDEAQNLGVPQLEQIRLLSNLETDTEKLLQIILIGQPELNDKLKLPELRQLRQRIAIHYDIKPLNPNDVESYIRARLQQARRKSSQPLLVHFTEKALEFIYRYTQGFPRVINILCDRALLASYLRETHFIDEQVITLCAKEVLNCEHNL